MFGPPLPWGRDPLPQVHPILTVRDGSRQSYPPRFPPLPDPRVRCRSRGSRRPYHSGHKHARFSDLDAPSGPEFSSPEWSDDGDPYAFDFDTEDDRDRYGIPPFTPQRTSSYSHRRASSPQNDDSCLHRVSVKLPSETAEELRHDEILIVPRLMHLHIRLCSPHAPGEKVLRAAVVSEMRFFDVVKQVVGAYCGDGIRGSDVRAYVKQWAGWTEPLASTSVEELALRGEVLREGRREVQVKIIVNSGEGERARVFGGGRGYREGRFRAGADAERRWEERRESSRGVERVSFAERVV